MGHEAIQAIVGIVTAIIGLAILSVLVSKNAQTSGVISAASQGLASDITAATGPVTGGSGLSIPSIGESSPVS